tara:strand:+ start:3734 stop:5512 length:1779 start_codon:yes stop_codon:yes gene_type:complete
VHDATHIISTAEELARLRAALSAAGDVAYDWDLASDAIHWSGDICQALGVPHGQQPITGAGFTALVAQEDLAAHSNFVVRLQTGDAQFECEYRLQLPQRGISWVHDRASVEFDEAGKPVRQIGILRFMDSDLSRAGRREHLANFDPLTGHFNRARLREALDHALNFSKRYEVQGAYLLVGVDKLTMVNQALGHEAADAVLLAIGDRLDRCLRASDVIGRVGGDRFGAILSNVPEEDIEAATDKILDAIRTTPIDTPEGPVYVTVSIGAVPFPGAINTAQDVMMRADAALQKAKQQGRDCATTYIFSQEQQQHHKSCIEIAGQVQRALREKRLRFAYQPIVDSLTRETRFHECLLRIVQPDGQVVVAGQFMPVVENLGMIRSVDRTVLERAVDELKLYPDARMAVNVSGLTTTDRSWMRSAVAMLRGRPDIAERMVIEITETAGLEDLEACCRFVSTLRDLGCEIALDDFGAGYTSFRHLKQLAVNKVKIDGSFVRKIGENPENLVFIRTLIDLARTFGLETVAECVETEEEAELLLNEGVNYMQGYAFGKPDLTVPWQARDSQPALAGFGVLENRAEDTATPMPGLAASATG